MMINNELEKSIVGALLKEPTLYGEIELDDKWFFNRDCQLIFEKIAMLNGDFEDDYELFAYLKSSNESKHLSFKTLLTLKNDCVTTEQLANNAYVLKRQYLTNEVQRLSFDAYEVPSDDNLIELRSKIDELEDSRIKKDPGNIDSTIEQMKEDLYKDSVSGIKSFGNLDMLLGGGLYPGTVTTLAGRPSQGKSVFAVNLIEKALKHNDNLVIDLFTLEMNQKEVIQRFLSKWLNVPVSSLRTANKTLSKKQKEQAEKMLNHFKGIGLNIDFESDTLQKMVRQIKKRSFDAKKQSKNYLLIIDYIGLVTSEKNHFNKTSEVSEITATIKKLASTRGIAVLQLAQMNRQVDNRGESALPVLSDLRDSGSVEQDSDVVAFIHRPDGLEGESLDLIIRKNRQGGLRTLNFNFKGEKMEIEAKYE